MKITFDPTNITVANLPKVKADMKEFKKTYTENDLVWMAHDALKDKYETITGKQYPWSSDIIRVNVKAFAYDDFEEHGTHFRVELMLDGYLELVDISFYMKLYGGIDAEAHWNQFDGNYMYTFDITRYKRDTESGHILYYSEAI